MTGRRGTATAATTRECHDWAGIFLLLTVGLAALMLTEPVSIYLMLPTVTTVALVAAGIGASALWFLVVLRRLGFRLRFARTWACHPDFLRCEAEEISEAVEHWVRSDPMFYVARKPFDIRACYIQLAGFRSAGKRGQ